MRMKRNLIQILCVCQACYVQCSKACREWAEGYVRDLDGGKRKKAKKTKA